MEENRLRVFKNMLLRKKIRPARDEVTQQQRRLEK
jgi:hypothetical protein